MISSTNKNLNMTAPCNTFSCTRWSKFPNCFTIRQKTYKTLMKWTPFLSHWEEQRHLLVWVGLGREKIERRENRETGRDRSFGDRIPIGKFLMLLYLFQLFSPIWDSFDKSKQLCSTCCQFLFCTCFSVINKEWFCHRYTYLNLGVDNNDLRQKLMK
jgi:hypothetical protein